MKNKNKISHIYFCPYFSFETEKSNSIFVNDKKATAQLFDAQY